MEVQALWALATAALPHISGNDYRVYVSLLTRVDAAGRWSGTFGEIGTAIGLSWPTVARAFSAIQASGLVRRIGETHRGSIWVISHAGHITLAPSLSASDDAPLTHEAMALERPRHMTQQRPSARDTTIIGAPSIKTPEPRVLNTPRLEQPTTTLENTAPNGRNPNGGGGKSSAMDDISSGNRGYEKLNPADRPDAQPITEPHGSPDSPEPDDTLDQKTAALLQGGVKDGRTRRELAAHHSGREIRKAFSIAASSKTAKDRAALAVSLLRRGTAAAALIADRENAAKATSAQAARTTAARATQSQAAALRAQVEEETAIIRAAAPALIREALAVAIVQGRNERRAQYAPRLVATDPAGAVADALHAFHRPRVAAWIRSAVPGKVRALPMDAESLL